MVNAKRGINLAGLEGNYGDNPKSGGDWDRSVGPEVGVNYPLHDPRLVDYYHSKDVGVIRLPFSWDRMQSQLWGAVPDPIPGYALYFSNFKQIVDYATNLGMTVIVEPWQADADGKVGGPTWLGQPVGDSPAHVDRYAFADFWQKLASIFKANPLVEYGLVNEPHDMSTMSWWTTAQKCVDYIRAAGATTTIYVPGNGYTAASRWTDPTVDTDSPQRSNAYGWLNVNDGQPLFDPLNKCVAEVHVYMDRDGSGNHDEVASTTIARQNLTPAMNEAAAQGYLMFVGEVAVSADVPGAEAAWADFIDYIEQPPPSAFVGYTWWAGGWPDWWKVTKAPYFSVSPTDTNNFVGDTTNMVMIEKNFH